MCCCPSSQNLPRGMSKMERCSSHPPLGSHTCRTPHNSFPPSFALGLIPTPAIMLIFLHGIHPQTNRDLLLALIPNPKMLILLTAHGKGFILLTCSPLARLVMHSETKAALMGDGQGEIRSCPREALAGGESCYSPNSQKRPRQCPNCQLAALLSQWVAGHSQSQD